MSIFIKTENYERDDYHLISFISKDFKRIPNFLASGLFNKSKEETNPANSNFISRSCSNKFFSLAKGNLECKCKKRLWEKYCIEHQNQVSKCSPRSSLMEIDQMTSLNLSCSNSLKRINLP